MRPPRQTLSDTLRPVENTVVESALRRERDLYLRCIELCSADDAEPLLAEALELLRETAQAAQGYVEIQESVSSREHCIKADAGIDVEERARIQARISRGIIAEAIETEQTIHVTSAMLDERFGQRESVRLGEIEAVLCVPVRAASVAGVVYLQNRAGGGPFDDSDVERVELIARMMGRIAGRLLELRRHRDERDATREIRQRINASGVLGRSEALARLLERLEMIAPMQNNVLLTGPSGTGKSTLARLLHLNSPRADGPFVQLNCAALPESLVESELFGAERGAHSGVAHRGVEGNVEAAAGGTLFLDEIGELPLAVQAKVLMLVEDKQYRRLGSNRLRTVDIRLIAATNRDLRRAIDARTFREDLYYRLRVLQLRVPALSERRGDIPLLAEHFVARSCARSGVEHMELSPTVLAAIQQAEWPGNVRELVSFCEEAIINARLARSTTIEMRHAFPTLSADEGASSATFQSARQQWERSFLSAALTQRDWNVAQTARELEMSRSHLNTLIRRYALIREG